MHIKQRLEMRIDDLMDEMLVNRIELEILEEVIGHPLIAEPGREFLEQMRSKACNQTKVLFSPDRDKIIHAINDAYSTVLFHREHYFDLEHKLASDVFDNSSLTREQRKEAWDRLKLLEPSNRR